MKPETWARIRFVFERSLELEAAERRAFVDRECRGSPDVRAEVERLLAADESAGAFLARPLGEGPGEFLDAGPPLAPGDRLGPFEVGALIASGGMGSVYEGVQDQPRRTVALKTLRHDLRSPARLQRFRVEAEVLGALHHPGIAQVYAAGTHESAGRAFPYFAMEFVEGARDLLEYADQEGLSRRRRLELFLRVCEAVQHAHAKGVIHRDLKAGNVLVDSSGHVKVIDFGVARAASDAEGESVRAAAFGTPETMSPEHASGRAEDVDARSDVWSLGCVLHALLTGRGPRDLSGLSTEELLRRVREEPPAIDATLPDELRWILAKALEREPERRYAGVPELAADLRRHLAGAPVEAAPPRAAYRLRKLARRHRLSLAAAAAVLAALAVGLYLSESARRRTVLALERADAAEGLASERAIAAERALARAAEEADKARETLAFFESAVENVDPQEGGSDVRLAAVLARMADSLEEELAGGPDLEAAIRASIGRSLRSIARYDEAEPHLVRALELREVEGADDRDRARSRHDLGLQRQAQGRLDEAEELFGLALADWETAAAEHGEDVGKRLATVNRLATVRQQQGRFDEAARLLEEGLELAARNRPEDDREALMTGANLAIVRRDQGRVEEGVALMRDVVAISQEARGDDHSDTVLWKIHLAAVLVAAGETDETAALLDETLDVALTALGEGHPYAMQIRGLLGKLRHAQGRYEEAASILEALLEQQEQLLGPAHPDALQILNNLAMVRFNAGQLEAAEELLRRSLELHLEADLLGTSRSLYQLEVLEGILVDTGRRDEAVSLLEERLVHLEAAEGEQAEEAVRDVNARLERLRNAIGGG